MMFEQSIVIEAPVAALFELTQDYRRRLQWDPFLRSAELLSGAIEPAVGVRATLRRPQGYGDGNGVCFVQSAAGRGGEDDTRPVVPRKLRGFLEVRGGDAGADSRGLLL